MAGTPVQVNFTSTQTWTVPVNCFKLNTVWAVGAGGIGSSVPVNFDVNYGSSGGASGGAALKNNVSVTPGEVFTVYVSTGGSYSGLFSATRGWMCLAYDGTSAPNDGSGAVGLGGSASVGDSLYNGNNGGAGVYVDGVTGGNGGNGGNSVGLFSGGGGLGGAGSLGPNGGNGGNATNWGAGGGGGGSPSEFAGGSQTQGIGGAGYQGIVELNYTPIQPPTVTSISPNVAQAGGSTQIVVTGTNFTNVVSAVLFGGVNATSFVVNSATQITVISPAHALGVVDVQVVNVDGTSPVVAADKLTYSVTTWQDNIGFGPAISVVAAVGVLRKASAVLSGSTSLGSNISSPQQFMAVGFSPSAAFATITFNQPKSLQISFSVATNVVAYIGAAKFINALLNPSLTIGATATQRALIKIALNPSLVLTPFLSLKQIQLHFAKMTAEAILPPPYVDRLGLLAVNWNLNIGFDADIMKVHFIGAALAGQVGISPDVTLDIYQWNSYGSQILYAASSGLEKAMIDADAPRLTGIDAEAIVDTWDPYSCPLPLLPYLAWAMGVTFWNDQWSEETKRSWIATQWQFKAFRGTDAGITMAVDFSGRDVSPFGYYVRDFITAPQGQYPSPGITHDVQEEWLATLPQVRTYLFNKSGQALTDEFYIKNSFIGTNDGLWDGQSFITPNTAKERLGKAAVWNVNGVDVANVSVLDYGNYFQLQMPGTASVDEFYIDQSWLGTDDDMFDGTAFCTPNEAWKQLVTIAPLTEAPYRIAVGPQYQAVEAQPELVTIPGLAGYDVFCGSNLYPHDGAGVFMSPAVTPVTARQLRNPQTLPVFPSFFLPSTSDLRIFYRYAVYDPDDLPTGGTQGTMFCGVGWFGYPPFTAEVDVFMAGTRCSQECASDDFIAPVSRYTMPQDNSATVYVAGAIEAARGLTQLTLLQPKPTPLFSAGKPFICDVDHYFVGQPQLSS
jgi:phage tail P2-like protein